MQMPNTVRNFFPGRDRTSSNSFRPMAYRPTSIIPRPIARWLAAGLILCPMMCACRTRGSRTIAMIPATTGPELWEAAHGGAEIAGREAGFHIYWNGPTREDDVARQVALVERAIEEEDAGLVIVPTNYLALVGSVRQALSKRIPTVVIRSSLPIPPGPGLSYILNDDEETGRLAAARIGMLLRGKGQVAVLGLDASGPSSTLRVRAFETDLAKSFPRISVLEKRAGSSNTGEVQQTAQEILVDNPGLDAILALDVTATEGTWAALSALGKSKRVKLIGCGQEVDLMAGIRHGDIDSVIVENTYEMGFRAIQWIAAQQRGESVPGKVELKPVLVTKANIDDAEIQKMLSVNWRVSH
jgi:ribose transport system substrate-binding protein